MRIPFFASLVVCSLASSLAVAQLPPPAIPETPVSAPVVTAAPLDQSPVVSDSNGSMALVVWNDDRSGETLTYAARIGAEGEVLDPLGIRIGHGIPKLAFWTGDRFLVLMEMPILHELVFIGVDGKTERLPLDVEEGFVTTLEGAELPRLLFLDQGRTSTDASYLRGSIVTLLPTGPSVIRIELPAAPAGLLDTHWLGASDGTDFLVLRYQRRESGGTGDRIAADRVRGDGSVVSSTDTGLTGTLDLLDVFAGKPDGYLLVRHVRPGTTEVHSYRLTNAGVYTGETGTLGPPPPPPFSDIKLIREGSHYLFGWRVPMPALSITRTYLTTVTTEGQFGSANLVGDWRGTVGGMALASQGTHRLIFEGVRTQLSSSWLDVMSTLLSDTFTTITQVLVSQSATLQSEVRVAASDPGYIVGWAENGPDRLARAFVRRFSSFGAPLDAAPREIYAVEQASNTLILPVVRLAATSRVYVVTWLQSNGLFARRISADGGDWIDFEPILIAPAATHFDVAANGSHALVAWTAECSQGQLCVMSRRLAMSGSADLGATETVVGHGFNYDVTAASNGNDFLVGWVDGSRNCVPTCGLDLQSVFAARVSASGATLDPAPLVLEDRRAFSERPVIAWDGENYVVLWSSFANGWFVRGVRVTPQGSVFEREASGEGTLVDGGVAAKPIQPVLARFGDQLVLMSRRLEVVSGETFMVWTAVTFPARTSLSQVRTLPRQEIFRHDSTQFGTVHAATSPRGLMYLGYDRVAEGIYAGVPRAFVTRFGTATTGRRRAVSR
jgi:hypothetical protein